VRFYLERVLEKVKNMEKSLSMSLNHTPLVLSGMASSSLGMANLPYGELPFHTNGKGIPTVVYDQGLDHPVLLISGIRSDDDVMRGEESQLIGVMEGIQDKKGKKVFLFPGTHSKHIKVMDELVIGFNTYMTGEFFELLAKRSILSGSVEEDPYFDLDENVAFFKKGVLQATQTNLLNASFGVRTNDLFEKLSKKQNHHFLSGLLIGTELKELQNQDSSEIYLCCSSNLRSRYETGLAALGIEGVHLFPGPYIDKAVVLGQLQIYKQIQLT
jgi:2-dehydro-3-deoxygalactonokinase